MGVTETLDFYFYQTADRRTKDWFLVESPVTLTGILLFYIYLVLKCGPNLMKNKKPFVLRGFIQWYNVFQIMVNFFIVISIVRTGRLNGSSLGCVPVDYSNDAISLANIFWYNYMVKLIDLIETMIFILRRKQRQVSFLHMYHHVSTVIIAWLTIKYAPGGMVIFPIFLNCTIHVIMYSYYFASSLDSPTATALIQPIKRYITIIQLVQFVALLIHAGQTLNPKCNHFHYFGPFFFGNMLMNFILFCNFYQKNYKNKV